MSLKNSGPQGLPKSLPPLSEIYVDGFTQFGSTNTGALCFTNIRKNEGPAVTYVPDLVNGDYFAINETGVYSVAVSTQLTASSNQSYLAIMVNPSSIPFANAASNSTYAEGKRAINSWQATSVSSNAVIVRTTWTGRLNAGDRVYFNTNADALQNTSNDLINITKISN